MPYRAKINMAESEQGSPRRRARTARLYTPAGRSNYAHECFGLFTVAYEFTYRVPGGLEFIYVNIAGNGSSKMLIDVED
jgi:hypothetical protein